MARERAQETRRGRRRRLRLERFDRNSRAGEKGEIYDFETKTYGQVNVGPEGFEPILKRLNAQVNEQILERLLALNQQRAAEEKSTPKEPRRTSRGQAEDEFV